MNPDVLLSLLHDKQQEVLALRQQKAMADKRVEQLDTELTEVKEELKDLKGAAPAAKKK